MTSEDPYGLRPGEIAVALPEHFDASVYFIGRIRTPWTRREDCPKNGRESTAECTIEVEDHGMGIALDEQEHLFERFFRASTAVDLHIQGVGLGLMVVKAIVDAHGGHVIVQSQPGSDTTFGIVLPLEPAARRLAPTSAPAESAPKAW